MNAFLLHFFVLQYEKRSSWSEARRTDRSYCDGIRIRRAAVDASLPAETNHTTCGSQGLKRRDKWARSKQYVSCEG